MKSFYKRYGVSPEGLVLCLDQSDPRSYGDLANWYDLSPYANHGAQATAGNQPAIGGAAGLSGMTRIFDGVDDYINFPFNGFPNTMTNITIAFWANPSGVSEAGSVLIAVPDVAANRLNIHFPHNGSTIYWDFGHITPGRLTVLWDNAWNDVWAYWVFISESGVGQKIYRNTVLLASDATTGSFSKEAKTLDIAKFISVFWEGLISQVQIWNRALNSGEIQALFNATRRRHGK